MKPQTRIRVLRLFSFIALDKYPANIRNSILVHRPLYICGPTASGKSAFAIQIAKQLDGEIINGDAYQVYKGIETLSAAPSAEELTQVPHHLFSVLSTSEEFDAQQYRDLAKAAISDVQSRGKTPILVGGSGMYLKFLTHGPSPVPASDPELRQSLELRDDASLVKELQEIDPEGAAITNLKNRRYVIRALEICLLSGSKMSLIKSDWKNRCDGMDKELRGALIQWETEALRKRIAQRTRQMLANGAIEELQNAPQFSSTCEKAIGVPQIRSYLAGEIDLDECEEKIFFATCQYAKRQRTWFKKEQWLTAIPFSSTSKLEQLSQEFIRTLEQRL